MSHFLRGRILALGVLALTGCSGCTRPDPPDDYAVRALTDPYDKIPARGAVSDQERAIAAVDFAGDQLHYGHLPGKVLQLNQGESWTKGIDLLLADGKDASLKLAWENLESIVVDSRSVPADIKLRARQAEGRIDDYVNTKADPDVIRKERIAEITWLLYQLAAITPDSGFR